jgi:hypothetical protein
MNFYLHGLQIRMILVENSKSILSIFSARWGAGVLSGPPAGGLLSVGKIF